MFCPSCGKEIPNDSNYCMYCGYHITKKNFVQSKVNGILDIWKPKPIKYIEYCNQKIPIFRKLFEYEDKMFCPICNVCNSVIILNKYKKTLKEVHKIEGNKYELHILHIKLCECSACGSKFYYISDEDVYKFTKPDTVGYFWVDKIGKVPVVNEKIKNVCPNCTSVGSLIIEDAYKIKEYKEELDYIGLADAIIDSLRTIVTLFNHTPKSDPIVFTKIYYDVYSIIKCRECNWICVKYLDTLEVKLRGSALRVLEQFKNSITKEGGHIIYDVCQVCNNNAATIKCSVCGKQICNNCAKGIINKKCLNCYLKDKNNKKTNN